MPRKTPTQGKPNANIRPKDNPPFVSLALLRKCKGLTLQAVCDHINGEFEFPEEVRRGTISAIETGQRRASPRMLDAIASALGIDRSDIGTTYEPGNRGPRRSR